MSGNNTSFNMPMAIRNGYRFVSREWAYLARFCLLPLGVSLITDIAGYYLRTTKISYFENFIWSIPAFTLMGWLLFIEARLLLLNERAPELPPDPEYVMERRRAMSASVLLFILFNMAAVAIYAYCEWGGDKNNPLINFFWLFLVGTAIWGVRFAVTPILAAVGYPIKKYIFQVNGISISLRLLALFLLTIFPVIIVQRGLEALILPEMLNAQTMNVLANLKIPESAALAIIVVENVGGLVMDLLCTATSCYALKEILSRPREEKTV